jgi:hypothetical protein
MPKFTISLTLIEESTTSLEIDADDIDQAKTIASNISPDEDLLWQFLDSKVETDEISQNPEC